MQQTASAGSPAGSFFPQARPAPRRQMIIAFVIGLLLLLVPAPEWLAANHIVELPGRGFYNQSLINAAADAGVFVMLALGLNIVVGYAGLLDLGYAAFFAIGTYSYAILA